MLIECNKIPRLKTWHINTPRRECRQTFSDVNYRNVFLDQSPKPIEIKAKLNKWDAIKFISFFTAKETINKKSTDWEKIFANNATNKQLISKIYK